LSVRYSKYLPALSLAGDFVILNLIFVAGFCWSAHINNCFAEAYLQFYAYLNVVWIILTSVFRSGQIQYHTYKKALLFAYIKIIVFFFFLFLIYFQVFSLNYYPRQNLEIIFPLFFGMLLLWKFGLYYIFVLYRKMGFNYRNVLIVGLTQNTRELRNYFMSNSLNGYRFVGYIAENKSKKKSVIGTWNELKRMIELHDVDEIYIGWEGVPRDIIPKLTLAINEFPLKVRIVPDLGEFSYKKAELVNYDLIPVLQIHQGPLSLWPNRFIKRTFDIIFSVLMIVGFFWWMSLILLIISLFGSREGVFFRQKRTGADGKIFYCLKYRTMRSNPDADNVQATKNDKRITPVGRFLRKASLDEFPQFINVFLGQMSVVGPRPHMLRHTHQYRKLIRRFMLRHTVKPGITGLAQIRGYRGEIRRISELKQRVSFDVNYIENWSFNLDLKIILLTLYSIIKGDKNAY
jgi:Undecaprenyl-phosphate glucose phosphotransferase